MTEANFNFNIYVRNNAINILPTEFRKYHTSIGFLVNSPSTL